MAELSETEMLGKMRQEKRNILLVLDTHGELLAGKLRSRADYPPGSRGHHPDMLEEWGLIEEVDRVGDEGERKFALTEKGERFVREYLTSAEHVETSDLEERVELLERQVTRLEERKLDESRFKQLTERLETEYWQAIMDAIEKRL